MTLWVAVLDYCAARRPQVAPDTSRTNRYTLCTFAEIVGRDLPARRLKRRHVEKWLKARHDTVKPATIRAQLGVIRSFCQWLTDDNVVAHNPCAGLKAPQCPESIPRECAQDEIVKLLLAVPDVRGEVMVLLMVEEGLRRAEVQSREIGDIDFTERLIFVRGKGRKERWLPLCADTWDALERYMHEFPATSGPLIRSYQYPNRPLHPDTITKLVSGWMRDAGIKKLPRDGKSPHALRHTMAGAMLDEGADVRDVQEALGHESLGSTWRYTKRRRATGRLREAMGRRSYRALPAAVAVATTLPPIAAGG